jgi:nitrogen PTS system EIIA component
MQICRLNQTTTRYFHLFVIRGRCNPPIDGHLAPPYGPPPDWARLSGALVADNFHAAFRAPGAAGGNSRAQGRHQELAARAATLCGRNEREILEVLTQRERLGSTGIGGGIAIPHGKLARLDRLFGVFARLERAIDFEALDGQPVDLMFLLIAPEGAGADHLRALAQVARLLRDPETARKLRESRDAESVYAVLTAPVAK